MENESEKKESALNKEETRALFLKCSPIFIALGDRVRQELLLELGSCGKAGINVASLTAKTNLSRPAISHHLKVLKDSNLIKPEKVGTQIFYKLNFSEIIDDMKKLMFGIIAELAE